MTNSVYSAHVVDSNPESSQSSRKSLRMVFGAVLFVVGSAVGFGVFVIGMLFLSFAGDSASSAQIPNWVAPMMFLVWPILIGGTVIVTSVATMIQVPIRVPIICGVFGCATIVTMWIVAFICMVSAS